MIRQRSTAAARGSIFVLLLICMLSIVSCSGEKPPRSVLEDADWDIEGDSAAHDPVIIYSEGRWYMYFTSYGLRFKTSEDGRSWTDRKAVFRQRPEWASDYLHVVPSTNIWAPDISKINGRYYLAYSLSSFGRNNSVIGLASTKSLDPDSPDYEWIDQGMIVESDLDDNYNAIDPDIYLDGKTPWLLFGSWWSGIKALELDSKTLKPIDPENPIALARRPQADAIEAPTVFKRGEYYYLVVSFDHCCSGIQSDYRIMIGRSTSITGPYYDAEDRPMLEGGGTEILSSGVRWKGPGHADVYPVGREFLLAFHSYDADKSGASALRIGVLNWDDEGWPSVSMEMDE